MLDPRRRFLGRGAGWTVLALAAAAGIVVPGRASASAWDARLFDTTSVDDTARLLGDAVPVPSAAIVLSAPEIAEDGAVVPVAVTSALPAVERIAILVEKNPHALAALFTIPDGTDAAVATRVKLAETTDVYALVQAGGRLHYARRSVKVTLGGCGG